MSFNIAHDRRFRRIELNASVTIQLPEHTSLQCLCVHFSEDGIDLKPESDDLRFQRELLKAGSAVSIQMAEVTDAPSIPAVVTKFSPHQIGLKFLDT